MTIVFPRDLPFDGKFTGDCDFEPVYSQSESLPGNASPNVAEVAPTAWRGRWSTVVTSRIEFAAWNAWLDSLRGGLRMFKGRPNRHRWPLTYPRGFGGLLIGGDPWDGMGNLSSIGGGRDSVTINGVPNGFVLLVGDFFSIPVGARQRIHRVTEGGVASGGAVTVSCEPIITPGVVAGSVPVRLDGPYCEMTLSGTPQRPRNPIKGGTISFEGKQALI